ncbi:MAG TPA: AAA family ATPase, partial [Fimbriimonadaceae bacterium]|nr:AAA family ATPase [Fimbriimonadaceae bacterium]
MLVELTVENIAIIERCQISIGSGFTVLTGETGAGKSLLVDALELALGERADTELVRTGATKASVSAVLDLSGDAALLGKCREAGIEPEGSELLAEQQSLLYIQREVYAEGRSQCRVNGKMTPVSSLRQLGQFLVDLHGQHDHQSLLDPARHIGFLDDWIGEPARALIQRVAETYSQVLATRQKLASLRAGLRDREHRLDLLRFQVSEIESAAPKPGELEEMETMIERLRNVERIGNAAALALDSLIAGDRSAADAVRLGVKAVEEAARYDPSLAPVLETLGSALVQIEEGSRDLTLYLDRLEADPERLEEVAGRIDLLRRLRRKYGEDEVAVLAFLEEARRELDLLGDAEASEEEFATALAQAETHLSTLALELSALRKERAAEFADKVQGQLRDLA